MSLDTSYLRVNPQQLHGRSPLDDEPRYADIAQHELDELIEQGGFPCDEGLDDDTIVHDTDTPLTDACERWQLEQATPINLLPF